MTPAVPAVLLVGNPKPRSRTLAVSRRVVHTLCQHLDAAGTSVREPELVDLSDLASALLADPAAAGGPAGDPRHEALETVRRARLLVVASPTFKGSYTGLLKVFLDQLPLGGLAGVVGVPVMTAASPRYGFAVDTYLAPLLTELGALVPLRGMSVLEADFERLGAVQEWCARAAPVLSAVLREDAVRERPAGPGRPVPARG